MNNKVKFLRGTSNEYAVVEKDSDAIYFTTDDGKLYIGDKEISGDGSITVDDTLSDTSTNPVQGNVIKQAIDNKADKSLYGDTTINVGRKAGTDVGEYSTAEGLNTTASGACSHAEGNCTTASGHQSHAEGVSTTASEYCSHAEGSHTKASGVCSHAGGSHTKALKKAEFAHGEYNQSNDDTLFSIGDGTSDTARHNAFEITTTGGKLHDKDIATVDLIPDLSPYAKTADVPNIKVNSAVDADTVGGLNVNEIASNPNLLINPDFRINQQGKSEYIGDTECWDQWTVSAGWKTARSDDDLAALFTCVTSQVNSWVVNQVIPNYTDYRGKTVTFSANVVTASTKFCLLIYDGVGQLVTPVTTGHFSVTYTVSDNATELHCVIATNEQEGENEQIAVLSTKLELGTIATTFVPPNPSIELAKVRTTNDAYLLNTNASKNEYYTVPENVDFPVWIYQNAKRYTRYVVPANQVNTNKPDNTNEMIRCWFDGMSIYAFTGVSRVHYVTDIVGGAFSAWKKMADGGNADTLDGLHADSFALKTDIPTSLPANGGNADYATNADTVDNVHILCKNDAIPSSNWFAAFTNENNLRAIDPERAYVGNAGNAITANTVKTMSIIGTASDVTHNSVLDWANSVNGFGTACLINAYGYPSDIPIQSEGFFTVETCYQNLRKYVTFKTFDGTKIYERAIWNSEWSTEWKEIYTSGNKPYVTGESSNFDTLGRLVTNHGFIPSAAFIWVKSSENPNETEKKGFILDATDGEYNTENAIVTGHAIGVGSSTYGYIIFK